MKKLQSFAVSFARSAIMPILVIMIFVGGSALAATFNEPSGNPPNGNVEAPVNVGITDQTKTGNFWAKTIGASNGFCIGSSCITSWPTGGGSGTYPTCQVQTEVVTNWYGQVNTNPSISSFPEASNAGRGCLGILTQARKDNGWFLSGYSNVRDSPLGHEDTACVFTRISCTEGTIQFKTGNYDVSGYPASSWQ